MADINSSAERKSKLQELIENEIPFTVIDDSGRTWTDMMVPDASNDVFLRFIAKWNMTPFVKTEPTFGTTIHSQGLVMVSIPYDKILGIVEMQVEEDLLTELQTKFPKAYEFWVNSNKTEAAAISPVANKIEKSDKVKAWESAHADELKEKNRTSAVATGWEEGARI